MARMYPYPISSTTKSEAEKSVYRVLESALDDSYTVFHSVAWQFLQQDYRPRDCEADFLIAHPLEGVLVLEVKGGAIAFHPEDGTWTSMDRNGTTHLIKDPVKQAADNRYALQDFMECVLGRDLKAMNFGYAVSFPDVAIGDGQMLPPSLNEKIVMDAMDVDDIRAWLKRCFAYYRGMATREYRAPQQKLVDALISELSRPVQLDTCLWSRFQEERRMVASLTDQQFQLLDMLERHTRALVRGCAGSGKTLIAIEKATRLARRGFRVLLTCYNLNLAEEMRRCGNPSWKGTVRAVAFHDLCEQYASKAGILPVKEGQEYYDVLLPSALARAATRETERFDAIVVDEGQDFHEAWWEPLLSLLERPDEGILYIFYDDDQRLYPRPSRFPIPSEPYTLTKNCRNTQAIYRAAVPFCRSHEPGTPIGPAGNPIEIVRYKTAYQRLKRVEELIYRLRTEGVPDCEIAVLTISNTLSQEIARYLQDQQNSVATQIADAENAIFCTTVYKFKGLERGAVILAEVGENAKDVHDLSALLYVGCTRARSYLAAVVASGADENLLRSLQGL